VFYFVPVFQVHVPGIHSFAGRHSLLLSWPLKKEEATTSNIQVTCRCTYENIGVFAILHHAT